jgi:AsmA protein
MKIVKVLFSLFTIAILLIIVAVIAIPQFVDPNDYKGQISTAIKDKTGLDVSINGDLSLSIFPWIGIKTGHIVLSQPKAILRSNPNVGALADIAAADIKVKLKPLFSRQVEIDTILLQAPRIELITDKTGNNSLDTLSATSNSTPSSNNTPNNTSTNNTPNNTDNQTKAAVALTVAGIKITDGYILIDDQLNKTRHELKALTISSGNILGGQPAPLAISAIVNTGDLAPIQLTLNTQLHLDTNSLNLAIRDLSLAVQQENNTLNTAVGNIIYQHAAAIAQISNSQLTGSTNAIPFSVNIPKITVDNNKTIVNIPTLSAESLDVNLSGNLQIRNWNKMIMVLGNIQAAPFNAKSLLKKLAIDYVPSHKNALEKVAIASKFNVTPRGLSLQNTSINIDNSQLEGSVAVVNFSQPVYQFDLSLNQINIDHYLPPTETNTQNSTPAADISPAAALAAPIVLLNEINANGVFRAKKITASNMVLENSHITVVSNTNTVVITPAIDLYQGKLNGTITLQRNLKNSAKPSLSLVTQLSKVNLEPLLTAAEITDQFSGIGNLSTNIIVSEQNGKPSSKGTIIISASDGAIKGIDIKKILDDAQVTIDKLRGKNVTEKTTTETDSTRFAEMSATLLLDNDIITNNDLSIKAPAFRVTGDGTVNIEKQTVDYLTTVVVVNTNTGQGGKDADSLKGLKLPVRFTGPLADPKYKIDFRALIKANTQQKANEEKAKIKEKVDAEKERFKNRLRNKLGLEAAESSNKEERSSTTDDLKEKLKKKLFDKLF